MPGKQKRIGGEKKTFDLNADSALGSPDEDRGVLAATTASEANVGGRPSSGSQATPPLSSRQGIQLEDFPALGTKNPSPSKARARLFIARLLNLEPVTGGSHSDRPSSARSELSYVPSICQLDSPSPFPRQASIAEGGPLLTLVARGVREGQSLVDPVRFISGPNQIQKAPPRGSS